MNDEVFVQCHGTPFFLKKAEYDKNSVQSGTPPYGHVVITATLGSLR